MPPRISPDRGVPRRGHRGGANRGSQFGGPSSINTGAATPPETTESISHVNNPSATGGRPSGNRGRGRGRGRGSSHGDAAASPSVTVPVIDATSETPSVTSPNPSQSIPSAQIPAPIATNHPTAVRGQPSGNRGRGRGRGASRGGTPGTPSGVETTPATPITSETPPSFSQNPHSAVRGQPFRGRGGYRGGARGSPIDSPNPVRGRSFRGGRGGMGGGFVAGPSDTTGSPAGIPGKSNYSRKKYTRCVYLNFEITDEIETFGAKRPGYGSGGRGVKIIINAFSTTVPNKVIYQYDGEIPFF